MESFTNDRLQLPRNMIENSMFEEEPDVVDLAKEPCLHPLEPDEVEYEPRGSRLLVRGLGTLQQLSLNLWQQDLLFLVLMNQHLRPHLSSRSQGMSTILRYQICLRSHRSLQKKDLFKMSFLKV